MIKGKVSKIMDYKVEVSRYEVMLRIRLMIGFWLLIKGKEVIVDGIGLGFLVFFLFVLSGFWFWFFV